MTTESHFPLHLGVINHTGVGESIEQGGWDPTLTTPTPMRSRVPSFFCTWRPIHWDCFPSIIQWSSLKTFISIICLKHFLKGLNTVVKSNRNHGTQGYKIYWLRDEMQRNHSCCRRKFMYFLLYQKLWHSLDHFNLQLRNTSLESRREVIYRKALFFFFFALARELSWVEHVLVCQGSQGTYKNQPDNA